MLIYKNGNKEELLNYRPWMYKLGENIISIAKEEKDLVVVIQDNLSPEKHINIIFGDTFRILRNIRMAFNILNKDIKKSLQ